MCENKTDMPAPSAEQLCDLAELFKVFGDSTRIRILCALIGGELCVGEIAAMREMTSSAVSHQLAILRRNKLIGSRREGKSIFYSLADGHVRTVLSQGLEHLTEK